MKFATLIALCSMAFSFGQSMQETTLRNDQKLPLEIASDNGGIYANLEYTIEPEHAGVVETIAQATFMADKRQIIPLTLQPHFVPADNFVGPVTIIVTAKNSIGDEISGSLQLMVVDSETPIANSLIVRAGTPIPKLQVGN